MGNVLKEYTIQFLKKHDRAKKLLSLFLCLSIFVSSGVLWQLKMIAVAANDSELGVSYETNHGDSTVIVTKKWEDGSYNHSYESSTFALYFNGNLINGGANDSKTLSASNNWTVIFNNMPAGNYSIEEIDSTTNANKYTTVISPAVQGIHSEYHWEDAGTTLEVGNVYAFHADNNRYICTNFDGQVVNNIFSVTPQSDLGLYWEFTTEHKLRNLSLEGAQNGREYLGYSYNNNNVLVWSFVTKDNACPFIFDGNGYLSAAQWVNGNLVPVSGAETNVWGSYNSGRDVNRDTAVTSAYRWTPVSTASYELVMTGYKNAQSSVGSAGVYNASDFIIDKNKRIDSLGDGDDNADTQVRGDDFYRLYLDVTTTVKEKSVDLLLVVDQSWSMGNDGADFVVTYNGEKVTRDYALSGILNGDGTNPGLIQSFLALNPGNNRICIVGFDGSRFIGGGKYPSNALSSGADRVSIDGIDGTFTPYTLYSALQFVYDDENKTEYYPYGSYVYENIENTVGTVNSNVYPYNYTFDSRLISDWTTNLQYADVSAAYSSGTNYEAGLMMAGDYFINAKDSPNEKVMIFISDGVPTCFIYNESEADEGRYGDHTFFPIQPGDRGGTTLSNYPPNVQYCKEPSKYAFLDFMDRMSANGIDLTVHTVGISNELGTESDAEVLDYYATYGGGKMFLSGNDANLLLSQLKALMTNCSPNNLVIKDTLSEYVEYYDIRPDVMITMLAPDSNEEVIIYDARDANNVYRNSDIVESVIYDSNTRTITAQFNPKYAVELGYKYTLSYNIMANENAYNYYIENVDYPTTGAEGTDYATNDTSSVKNGFYSNKDAEVAFDFAGKTLSSEYPHPVVQIDEDEVFTSGSITVSKFWQDKDGVTIVPQSDVTIELHQVGIFEDNVAVDTQQVGVGENKERVFASKQILLGAANQQVSFDNVPLYGFVDGLRYKFTYYVVETDNNDFMQICYLDDNTTLVDREHCIVPEPSANTNLTLINKEKNDYQKTGNLTVSKLWQNSNGDNIGPQRGVTIELHQIGTAVNGDASSFDSVLSTKSILVDDINQYVEFSNLPYYGIANGVEYKYTYYVVEKGNNGYEHICYLADSEIMVDKDNSIIPGNETSLVLLNKEKQLIPHVPPVEIGGVNISKQIDDLGDGVKNPDTSLVGTDSYRLYLDVMSDVEVASTKITEPVDLVLVVDQSWSMTENTANYKDSGSITRETALSNVLLGSDGNPGFIDTFLDSNSGNRISIVGCDGSLFTSRDIIPATAEEFSNNWNKYTDSSKPLYMGYQEDGVQKYYDINDILAQYHATSYKYELDSQIVQTWTDSSGWSGCSLGATLYTGSNYEAGLLKTLDVLKSDNSENKKVVIFLAGGLPTCYIDGDSNFRKGTALADNDNILNCIDPSKDAFVDFVTEIEGEGIDVTFNSIEFSANTGYDSVLATYVYGDGATYVNAKDDFSNLYTSLLNMAYNNQSIKPDKIVVEDTLSSYVELTSTPEILVTMNKDGIPVTLYKNNAITNAGYGIIESVTVDNNVSVGGSTTQKVTVEFVPNYVLIPGVDYSVSYNVRVTEAAKNYYYAGDKGYPDIGDPGTDYVGNFTSSGVKGFRSNYLAQAKYDDGSGSTKTKDFPHPVVQIDLGMITINKVWVDSISGDELPPEKIPDSSVEVQLYQVATELVEVTDGGWVLDEDELDDGVDYLIVSADDNYLLTASSWTPYRAVALDQVFSENSSKDYSAYTYKYHASTNSLEYSLGYLGIQYAMGDENTAAYSYMTGSHSLTINNFNGLRLISESTYSSYAKRQVEYYLRVPPGKDYYLQNGIPDQSDATYFKFYRYETGSHYEDGETTLKEYGTPVTISANSDGVWAYTYEALPKTAVIMGSDDREHLYKYTYYVVEKPGAYTPEIQASGTDGIWDGNETMTRGTYTITNKVDRDFTLPNTGGVGIYNNILCGLLIIGGGLFFGVKTKKRERRQSSA